MALSSSPAKTTTTTTTTASVSTCSTAVITTPRPFTNPQPPWRDHPRPPTPPPQPPHYHHHHHHRSNSYQLLPNLAPRIASASIRPLPPPPQGILYPVASSGRGFLSKPPPIRPPQIQSSSSDQAVTIANPGGFPPRPVYSQPPLGFPHLDLQSQALHMIRSTHLKHTLVGSTGGGVMGKGVPVSSSHLKVAPSRPSVSDSNGRKDLRDRTRDDAFATVRDRKVRIYEGSLYAHCRSWLRNGYPEENQPLYVDGVKSLPKPLPTPVAGTHLWVKKDGDREEQEEEGSVEHFSPKDLLQRHIKRAKRVRAQLREQRLQRIARYKSRLALLLPPLVEQQQFRNDTDDPGN